MKVAGNRLFYSPVALACVASAIALTVAGWLKSGVLLPVISAAGSLLLIAALAKLFQAIDFSSPRLLNATTRQLAWIRIVICLTALIYTVIEDLPSLASLPVGMRNPVKFSYLLNNLPGFNTLFSSPHLLGAVQWTTAALLLLGLLGFQTRISISFGALGFFFIQAFLRHYTYLYHSGLVPIYLLLLLPWTPCEAAWSLDRTLNRSKPQPNSQLIGFSIFAIYAVMATIYFISGLSKLRDSGLDWFNGGNIEQKLVRDALEPIFLNYKWKATLWLIQHHAPDFVFTIIGGFGLVTELGYIGVLFSRKAQIILPIMAFCVHLGILVFQHLLFLDFLLLQLIFLDIDRVAGFLRRAFGRKKIESPPGLSKSDKSQRSLSHISTGAVAFIIVIFLVAWVWRVEYYPLTSWQMYAKPEPRRPVLYLKIIAALEDGRSIEIPPADVSPVVIPNIRYFLMRAFLQSGRSKTIDQFFDQYVQRRNRELTFGSPIRSLEIQKWRWNYILEPNDPRRGWVTNVYPYDATSKPSLRQ